MQLMQILGKLVMKQLIILDKAASSKVFRYCYYKTLKLIEIFIHKLAKISLPPTDYFP